MKLNKLFKRLRFRSRTDMVAGAETVLSSSFYFDNRGNARTPRLVIGEKCYLGCGFVAERDGSVIKVGDRTYIGSGTTIISANAIHIGSDVLMAWGITIVDHDSHSVYWKDRVEDVERWRMGMKEGGLQGAANMKNWDVVPNAPVIIEDNVWVGFNAIILKGIHVGRCSVIAAGSVVTKDVPSFCVVAGNPARVVKEIERTE